MTARTPRPAINLGTSKCVLRQDFSSRFRSARQVPRGRKPRLHSRRQPPLPLRHFRPPQRRRPPPPQALPAAAAASQPARAPCNNPNALGVARTVEIDTTGGPGFGFEHFKELDFLRDKEVVLTFDDGPWPVNTPSVLKTLENECTTGIFFPIGKHATYEPELLKKVYAAGHTIGSHTWAHAHLNNKKLSEH